MNRKDRRRMAKNLGIMKYQQKLPLNQKFELIRENIISGKKSHEEFIENNRVIQEQFKNEVVSNKLYALATDISKREQIPFIDALEKAKLL